MKFFFFALLQILAVWHSDRKVSDMKTLGGRESNQKQFHYLSEDVMEIYKQQEKELMESRDPLQSEET